MLAKSFSFNDPPTAGQGWPEGPIANLIYMFFSDIWDFFDNLSNVPNGPVFEREPTRHRVLWADFRIGTECDGHRTDRQQTDEQKN